VTVGIQPFPTLDYETEAALRASIERFGVLVPVVKDQHGRILDGHHRDRIASDLGVEYESSVRVVADDDEAQELARTLNSDRRHLTKQQRQEIAVALRQEGHSYLAIAGVTGVSKSQTVRDVQESIVPGRYVAPERVATLDGRTYPAIRKGRSPLSTERGQLQARAHRDRLTKALAKLAGTCQGIDAIELEYALEAARPDDLAAWRQDITSAASTLSAIRKRLKGAS
jgi:ParB-like chromosome segregation protein Spo0J